MYFSCTSHAFLIFGPKLTQTKRGSFVAFGSWSIQLTHPNSGCLGVGKITHLLFWCPILCIIYIYIYYTHIYIAKQFGLTELPKIRKPITIPLKLLSITFFLSFWVSMILACSIFNSRTSKNMRVETRVLTLHGAQFMRWFAEMSINLSVNDHKSNNIAFNRILSYFGRECLRHVWGFKKLQYFEAPLWPYDAHSGHLWS